MSSKVVSAVFPAAGLGTRFLPATKAQPKEMLSLIDKPLIQYGVEEAVRSGIEKVIIVTGRGKVAIEDHFDKSFELEHLLEEKQSEGLLSVVQGIISDEVDVCYIRQKEAKGLGHAVLRARRLIGHEPFAVVLADDIIDAEKPCVLQLIEAYESLVYRDPDNPPGAVLAVMEVPPKDASRYGTVVPDPGADTNGGLVKIVDMVEKAKTPPSNLAIIGRYVLAPEIFDSIHSTKPGAGGEIQLTDAIKQLSQRRNIYAVRFKGTRYDAGDKLGFLKATVALALDRPEFYEEFGTYLMSDAIRDKCRREAT
jgi:UTP--glucose-1-phosphate uridylyltransferase